LSGGYGSVIEYFYRLITGWTVVYARPSFGTPLQVAELSQKEPMSYSGFSHIISHFYRKYCTVPGSGIHYENKPGLLSALETAGEQAAAIKAICTGVIPLLSAHR
jgi:transcriptional regulator GlxA family with amidase domain